MEHRSRPIVTSLPPPEAGMGVLCGLALWLGGWGLQHAFATGESPVVEPLFWVLASAPFWVGGLGWLAGDRRRELQQELAQFREATADSLRELNRRELVARVTLQSVYDAVLLLNDEGVVMEASDAASWLFGHPQGALVGLRIDRLLPEHERLDKAHMMQRRAPMGDKLAFEWRTQGQHADGTRFAADVKAVLLSEQALQVFLIRDAAARVLREERLVRDAQENQKDRWVLEQRRRGFVVQMLGDAMRGELERQLEALDALGSPPEQVAPVRDSSHRVLESLDQLWNLAMWERSAASPTVGPVELRHLLDAVTEDTLPMAKRHGARVLAEIQGEVEEIVSDAHLLGCALRNLILHALRRTRGGAVRVEVAREAGRGTDWVAMFVEDDGERLSMEELEQIHACFALSSEISPPPDARAGLALTHRLARSLGGHVAVHSSETGNVMSLRIPIEPAKVKVVPARPRLRMDSLPPTEFAQE